MSFDQTAIQDVTVAQRDAELAVSWVSLAPDPTTFQVYLNGTLAWSGSARTCVVPYPNLTGQGQGRSVQIDVGTVLESEATTSFSGSLPAVAGGGQRVTLEWLGGTFLDLAITGFHVYQGTAPSGAVDYSSPVGTVAAYPQDLLLDGYGMGPYGQGGYGHAASSYSWTSTPLAAGTWNFGIKPFRLAGDEGTAATTSAVVSGPPRPPARNASGQRLTYEYKRGTPGGYGSGGYGAGGYGTGAGYGSGGYGLGGYGVGEGDGLPYLTLTWLSSPGY